MDLLKEAYRRSAASRTSPVGHLAETTFTSEASLRVLPEPKVSAGRMQRLLGWGSGATRHRGVAPSGRDREGAE